MWRAGVFDRFWFWTVTYAREYVQERPLRLGWIAFEIMFPKAVGANFALWMMALAGLVLVWWKKEDRTQAVFLTALLFFLLFSGVSGVVFSGALLQAHPTGHRIAGGGGGERGERAMAGRGGGIVFRSAGAVGGDAGEFFVPDESPLWKLRGRCMGTLPFAEAVQVADYIRAHSEANPKSRCSGRIRRFLSMRGGAPRRRTFICTE